ncbi:MAG: NUDIX domain-containing protein [Deltaproteobacteria bacterium]|jgi:hypothetical protein|nr:NUDIX domain-containing protein [Deltaproteobacteria bacterium]
MPEKKYPARFEKIFQPPDADTLEVLDHNGSTLLLMPGKAVLQQKLPHRAVLVLLRDPDKKILIRRYPRSGKSRASLWNVSAIVLPRVGEAREEAALRVLREEFGMDGPALFPAGEKRACPETRWKHLFLFLSRPAGLSLNPRPPTAGTMLTDENELKEMLLAAPQSLAPELHWAAGIRNLFRP